MALASIAHAQQCTQQQLNTEFTTDPTGRQYSTCAPAGAITGPQNDDQCTLDKFNAPCTNNAACKVDQTISRETLWEVVDPTEWQTLVRSTQANDVARVKQFDAALQNVTFNMGKSAVRQKLLDVFPAPTAPVTNAAIAALQQKDVPRSHVVCKRPGTLTDVSCGLRGACS